jgi:hypothetical protein
MPTPAAVGQIMQTIARRQNINVLGVDIGGATTDVFSVFAAIGDDGLSAEPVFNRTVSANLGMSYSISNVLAEATMANVIRWIAIDIEEADLRDRIKNKMIRPTTIPQMLEELQIEQGVAREALRLALIQHRALAVGLKGVQTERTLSDVFEQAASGDSLIDMMALDLLVGSGGVLSHAPRRSQTTAMLIDAFQPEGVTQLAVDSIFMMPHLGVLASVDEKAATDVFERDCIVYLGTCVAPVGGSGKTGEACVTYDLEVDGAPGVQGSLRYGDLEVIPLADGVEGEMVLRPARGWDVGTGAGQELRTRVRGGVVGLILDGRGRPVHLPDDDDARRECVTRWNQALGLYADTGEEA